jgi:lysine-ketoglutarate reductase/saccharopine dehydrogenase-like protein (TIGR00300 family)
MLVKTVILEGHILDSHTLSKVLDFILARGGSYEILDLNVGCRPEDLSRATMCVGAEQPEILAEIIQRIELQGGVVAQPENVRLQAAPADGVFPEDFYSTTNLETFVTLDGEEIPVRGEAMDLGIVVEPASRQAWEVPMDEVRAGQLLVVGHGGIRVKPLPRGQRRPGEFGFMLSEVSVEKPRRRALEELAGALKEPREALPKNLLVLGPAVVHSGAVEALEKILARGHFQVLFGGNAIAAHDIEYALLGTSLGIEIKSGRAVPGGHRHHLKAINTIRGLGGIRPAIAAGVLRSGLMYQVCQQGMEMVLAGSIRDDGPLPEVVTDAVAAKRLMREAVKEVGVAVLVATTLHAVATGNLLPARVKTYCVDINPTTVTKLLDRGSAQTTPIVMDCEAFFHELEELTR